MFDVVEVIHELLAGIIGVGSVGVVDLSPASDTWCYDMALVVVGDLFFVV